LRIGDVIQAVDGRKIPPMTALLERMGIGWDEVAFVGDDLADVPVLRRVGLPIAVANAVPEVKAIAAHVTSAPGGHGAVREVVRTLLTWRGEWDAALQRYLRPREVA
jgi:3-deoxy-D-manno-octulosonate 8-phosphate phosphatase (KDO 8-P phosphatase)